MKTSIFDKQLSSEKLEKIRGGVQPQITHIEDSCEQLFDDKKFNKNIGWCGSGPGGSSSDL